MCLLNIPRRTGVRYKVISILGIRELSFKREPHTKLIINAGLRLLQKFMRYWPSPLLNLPSRISVDAVLAPSG